MCPSQVSTPVAMSSDPCRYRCILGTRFAGSKDELSAPSMSPMGSALRSTPITMYPPLTCIAPTSLAISTSPRVGERSTTAFRVVCGGDAAAMPWPADHCGLAVGFMVLHDMPDPAAVLAEICARPGTGDPHHSRRQPSGDSCREQLGERRKVQLPEAHVVLGRARPGQPLRALTSQASLTLLTSPACIARR